MPLHLVTGYKGEAHITPSDIGALNAGLFGDSDYVMFSGNKFAASILSNNAVRILDGDLMIQGRHITLKKDTYEDITINNGTIGKNRNDLIVIRYTLDTASGVENAEFAVIQGEETAGTAADPEHTTGDIFSGGCTLHEMPLYRIPLTELTVGTPEPLFKLRGSMDAGLIFKGWNPLSSRAEDTPEKWKELGSGIWMIDIADIIIGQPNQYGFLYNTVCYGEIAQIFVVQASGATYRRNANGIGWYGTDWKEGTWRLISDEETRPVAYSEYWGTGAYGEGNPNSLSFNFVPKFLVVASASSFNMIIAVGGEIYAPSVGSWWDSSAFVRTTWDGNTITWYSVKNELHQLNQSGHKYLYFAIG